MKGHLKREWFSNHRKQIFSTWVTKQGPQSRICKEFLQIGKEKAENPTKCQEAGTDISPERMFKELIKPLQGARPNYRPRAHLLER